MRVVGIDVSTKKIACVLLDSSEFQVIEFISRQKSWDQRLVELQSQFWDFVETKLSKEDSIFIEEIPFVHNRQGLIRLVHVLAMCKVAATHFNVPCTYVNVKTWKQRVVGNGNATKKDIADKAELIYGDRVSQFSQDALDALMVATYGFVLKSYKKWASKPNSLKEHYKGVIE